MQQKCSALTRGTSRTSCDIVISCLRLLADRHSLLGCLVHGLVRRSRGMLSSSVCLSRSILSDNQGCSSYDRCLKDGQPLRKRLTITHLAQGVMVLLSLFLVGSGSMGGPWLLKGSLLALL